MTTELLESLVDAETVLVTDHHRITFRGKLHPPRPQGDLWKVEICHAPEFASVMFFAHEVVEVVGTRIVLKP